MTTRVLIVDDSGFFRRRIREMLESGGSLQVVGEAADGKEAVREALRLRPDVITMDIEMPVMDGISAVREIMRRQPTPVLMFSSLTFDGARATLDALDAGAVDFLPKRFSEISSNADTARQKLIERVRAVGAQGRQSAPARGAPARRGEAEPKAEPARPAAPAKSFGIGDLDLVVIGASTGGPVALQRVMGKIPAGFRVPVLLIQHMPANFTTAFAQRLDGLCPLKVREAADGDVLRPGEALLAPGGFHAGIRSRSGTLSVQTTEPAEGEFYKPSVDVAFRDAARCCRSRVLGIVMTGMGADGARGAADIRRAGGHIWCQDEPSSVIYGMPAAIAKAGLQERELPLEEIGPALARLS